MDYIDPTVVVIASKHYQSSGIDSHTKKTRMHLIGANPAYFKIDKITVCVSLSAGTYVPLKKHQLIIHEKNLRKKTIRAELGARN